METIDILNKNKEIGGELYHAAMLLDEHCDPTDPFINLVLEHIGNAMRSLAEMSRDLVGDETKKVMDAIDELLKELEIKK